MYEFKEAIVDSILRDHTDQNRTWIEKTLSAPLSDLLQLELPYALSAWAARYLLPDALAVDSTNRSNDGLYQQISKLSLPPDAMASLRLGRKPKSMADGKNFDCYWSSEWLECPIAFSFSKLAYPVVVLNVAYKGDHGRKQKEVVLVRSDTVEGLIALLEEHRVALRGPRITHYGDQPIDLIPSAWEDVIMDQTASKLLRDDFISFFKRREWFREKRLAFRRGYLLHGPPGNGKTSAVRAMLSHPGVTGHSLDLMARYIDDGDLRKFSRKRLQMLRQLSYLRISTGFLHASLKKMLRR